MKTNETRVPTRFEPETRFEVQPAPAANFRATEVTELERLKTRLLKERLARIASLNTNVVLRRAANDAAAVAWSTAFPLLLFPALFEEKARVAQLQAARQSQVRARSLDLLAA
ncbi:MAG: hypothetical protein EPO07_00770 [Verrucomicrobia bacterium]|nr:MAG: hypothetical protein EPO07_00770 [Verrucomicrobiota bacterium]